MAVSDDQIVYLQDARTAKGAWDNLTAVYDNAGTANKMYLQEKLMRAKLEQGKPLKAHIEDVRRIVSKLSGIGLKISNDEYKLALLRSLPSSYESLIFTLKNLIDGLKIEDAHARLLREEARQKTVTNDTNGATGKLFQTRTGRKGFTFFRCGKRGHIERKCKRFVHN